MTRQRGMRKNKLYLHDLCLTIAWATTYAKEALNESHRMWPEYFAYSEWFRHLICAHFKLPLDAKWEVIYRKVGVLVEEEYATKMEFEEAYSLGNSQYLEDPMVHAMFEQFEMIKYQITERF